MGTVVVLAILAGVVALIVRKMIKDKKNGKSIQSLRRSLWTLRNR